jgi:glucose 1-dehydrogenase
MQLVLRLDARAFHRLDRRTPVGVGRPIGFPAGRGAACRSAMTTCGGSEYRRGMLLEGKTLIVTGGSSGIGAAIGRAAAAEGANVVIDYLAHSEEGEAIVRGIVDAGGSAVGVAADVSQAADLQRLIETAAGTYGRLDVLVNNAGIETRSSLLETTEADYERVMAVNLKSAFFGTQLAARQFIAQGGGGTVINISSVHEDWPMPGNIAYCISKGGMRMLTRTAGVELGVHGIRVVNICPGAVATPINQVTLDDPVQLRRLQDAIPLGRVAEPDEIAAAAVFIASGRSGYMTATSVFIDGGIMQGSVGL